MLYGERAAKLVNNCNAVVLTAMVCIKDRKVSVFSYAVHNDSKADTRC